VSWESRATRSPAAWSTRGMTAKRDVLVPAVLGLLLGSLVLGGCGTQRADSGASSAPPAAVSPTPSADEFVGSLMRTRDLATAALEITVSTDVGGDLRTLTGSGTSAVSEGYGELLWTDADGAASREVSNGKGLFVQTDVPDGLWTRLPDERSTPTGRLADPLRGLGSLQDVVRAGPEELDGIQATRYTGTLPASPDSLLVMGFTDEELVAIGEDWQGAVVEVTVWVDGAGRVIGIERSLDLPAAAAGPVTAETMTELSDFSLAIDLAPPPTESVVEAPEGQ
jgi:hypothetical protein